MFKKIFKKNKKRRIRLMIWIIVSFLLLSGSAYAWFSMNRFGMIDYLNINVDARGEMQISVDAIRWGTLISNIDLLNARNTFPTSMNQLPNQFRPVSTAGDVDRRDGTLRMFYGEALILHNQPFHSLSAIRNIEVEGNENGNFMAFDLFFQLSQPSDIYLTPGSNIRHRYEDPLYVGIENAFRVAFLIQGHDLGRNLPPRTIQQFNGATNDDVYIWELNYDVHTEHAVNHARDIYGIQTTTTNAARIPYDGIINEFPLSRNVPVGRANSRYFPDLFRPVDIAIATPKDFNTNQFLFRLPFGITKVRIYIWIEGQDVDCEDNAAYGRLEMSLEFTTFN